MERAAEELRFERAAALRDQIQAIEQVVERQKVISTDYIDSDVLALARSNGEACVQVFFIRGGKLIGRDYFIMEGTQDTPSSSVMAEFIKQFYDKAPLVPSQLLLPEEVEEATIIKQWLTNKRGGEKVEILVPRHGQQQELIQMAAENAAETLASLQAQWQADTRTARNRPWLSCKKRWICRLHQTASSVMTSPTPWGQPPLPAWSFSSKAHLPRNTTGGLISAP
jgi:excinuclease ABC subunit C